jgi:TIR domain
MKVLFARTSIFNVVERLKQELKSQFQNVSNAELDADPVALEARLIEQFSLSVPVLEEEKKYALTREVQVDVSRDPQRFISDRSRPFYVAGTEITIAVPFQGDVWLFEVQPSMFTLNPPVAEIAGNELHLVYRLTNPGFNVEGEVARTLAQVNQYLHSLRGSAEVFKAELQPLVHNMIEQRKRERGTHTAIVADLKIPVRQAAVPREQQAPTPRSAGENARDHNPPEEWDVFISHASEDKVAIATPLAEALRELGLRVWYDDFSLRVGDSLFESINRGLARSRYGVVILSGYFFGKHWPQQELNGLATREVGGKKVVLPVWHGVGVAEVRSYSPILADRVAVHTKDGLSQVVAKIAEAIGMLPKQ